MNPLARILTAVDSSDSGRVAFDHALALSRTHNAELTIVHAVPDVRSLDRQPHERVATIQARREAAEAAGIRYKIAVRHGDPAGVVLRHARARRPDLIVLSDHKRSGFDRFRFGSVADNLGSKGHARSVPESGHHRRGSTVSGRQGPVEGVIMRGDRATLVVENI